MRTFTKPVPLTVAVEWLEKGRENLYGVLDLQSHSVVKLGSLPTVEGFLKSKKGPNKANLRLMSYKDLRDFHRRAAPTPVPAATQEELVGPPVPDGIETAVPLNSLTVQMVQSIISEQVKQAREALTLHHRPVPNLSKEAQELIALIREFEEQGYSLLDKLNKADRHDEVWTTTASVQFGQATMAMVRSLTEAAVEAETV